MKHNNEAADMKWGKVAPVPQNPDKEDIQFRNSTVAWNQWHQRCIQYSAQPSTPEDDAQFVKASLAFSNISSLLGQGMPESERFLRMAKQKADELGDARSHCLINLRLGQYAYVIGKRTEALKLFEEGKAEVDYLGDEDIKSRAVEYVGLYYFLQGMFLDAKFYFEIAAKSFESAIDSNVVRSPSAPALLSYCFAFTGHFHEAIGTLDYYRRLALDRSEPSLAAQIRATLGIILAMIKNVREAEFHLAGALREATARGNALAVYYARGGLAYLHFLEGRMKEYADLQEQQASDKEITDFLGQYVSPMMLEMFHKLNRALVNRPNFEHHSEFQRIMLDPNIHLRGVALRLKAIDEADRNENDNVIEADLNLSEQYLVRSGDPVQLAKTWLEMARLHLRRGNKEKARSLAQKAWKGFSGYGDVFYPDDLRHLLVIKSDISSVSPQGGDIELFIDMLQSLAPSMDMNELLNRAVAATNRFLGAERGCIFWFGTRGKRRSPEPKGLCNLSKADIAAEEFRPNLTLVFKAFRENRPQIVRQEGSGYQPCAAKAVLCIPITAQGSVQGVLYHDNSYVRDCFDYFNHSQLMRIAQYLSKYIDNVFAFGKHLEQKSAAAQSQFQQSNFPEIITESPVMLQILSHTDRIAASESAVLILGETGVGKELIAQRLHKKSPRHKHPFIIVDMTAIPENLFESELFGHEKGAFTSADHQQIGRMEMANGGTLFIDEIGETPKSIQAKLLRVLQEKSLYRIGGSKPISSDFRLVAATNRDLAAEVAAGNFREDLYYRLNVLPLTLPPLRDRKEDIPLLAKYYLDRFANKYMDQIIELTPEDEKKLMAYRWPGNVRELRNVIERAVLLWNGTGLVFDLPQNTLNADLGAVFIDAPTLDEMQRRYIRRVLELTYGRIGGPGGAASILGMKRTSMNSRMKKLGMR